MSQSHRSVFAFSLALFGLCVYPASADDTPKQKPNILFIIADDLKPLLGCYGTSWIQSPNLDRLAAKGTVFMESKQLGMRK